MLARVRLSVVALMTFTGLVTALVAQPPASLAGNWAGSVDTDQGTMDIAMAIEVTAGKASGTITTAHGELVISNGVFVKDKWRLPFNGHGMKGEIVGVITGPAGDAFEGVWDNSPTATGSVKLRRTK